MSHVDTLDNLQTSTSNQLSAEGRIPNSYHAVPDLDGTNTVCATFREKLSARTAYP